MANGESNNEVSLSSTRFNSQEEAYLDLVNKYKEETNITRALRTECMFRSNHSDENEL